MLKRFLNGEEGQSMTEYILIVVLVAIAAIAVVRIFGQQIIQLFNKSAKKLEGVEGELDKM
ncbi:MAG: hypothetical protein JW827_07085 [Spirochaetes bacterium]|nr:hypothetical protein [Spirochaetota bacterium]